MPIIDNKVTTPFTTIQDLSRKPTPSEALTYTQLQALFDKDVEALRLKHNLLIDDIISTDGFNIKTSGVQTINGVKTFTESPIIPTPTTDMQPTNKKYISDNFTTKTENSLKANSSDVYTKTQIDTTQATKSELQNIVLGQIPDGSLTDDKLSDAVGDIKERLTTSLADNMTDHDIIRLVKTSTGTVNALAINTTGIFDLTRDGNMLMLLPNLTNTSSVTISIDSQTTKAIKKFDITADAYVDLVASDLKKNTPTQIVWSVGNNFFILRPSGGGSNIKSIQSGQVDIASTSIDITISAVDLTKSIPIITYYNNQTTPSKSLLRAKLINSTTLRIYLDTYGNVTPLTWKVIEFNNVKSLQTGDTSSSSITVSSVNVNKSVLFASSTSATTTGNAYNIRYTISNPTTITIDSIPIFITTWYLIEFN